MNIPVILGTAREGRQSEQVAFFILEQIKKFGIKSELIDVKNYLTRVTDRSEKSAQAKKLKKKISTADALIIVAPEYNHGYPGELKLMLDMLYDVYSHKPLGICGVSAGNLGGARMVEGLRTVAIEFHMVPIREALYFPAVQDLFDKGKIKDPTAYDNRIKAFINELSWYAR